MSDLIRWEPFREMVSLRDSMNRLFDDRMLRPFEHWPFSDGETRSMALDMYETDEELVVEASLPGIPPDDVDISVIGKTLTIKGETKHEEEKEEKGKYFFRERHYGSFQRTVTLPVEVDADKAKATFSTGTLKLTLPKVEEAKPKHIKVKA